MALQVHLFYLPNGWAANAALLAVDDWQKYHLTVVFAGARGSISAMYLCTMSTLWFKPGNTN